MNAEECDDPPEGDKRYSARNKYIPAIKIKEINYFSQRLDGYLPACTSALMLACAIAASSL